MRLIIVFILFGLSWGCTQTIETRNNHFATEKIDSLLQDHEVFKANRLFIKERVNIPYFEQHLFSAILGNAFNKSKASNDAIDSLFQYYNSMINDSIKCALLQLELQNHIKLYNYKNAIVVTNNLLDNYTTFLSESEINDLKNELNIWIGLKNTPQQIITKKEYTLINSSALKIPIVINDSDSDSIINLLFDTGANFSIIIESLAEHLNLDHKKKYVDVKGILGNKISAEVAVAPSLKFGNIEIENVVFLVFPDSTLYFKEANFQINGLIGYPVISALDEIHIIKGQGLIIPAEETKSSYSNLAMDFLTPLIEVYNGTDSLIFIFDSGANTTWLYEKYYKKYKSEIEGKYEQSEIMVGGVGNMQKYNGYYLRLNLIFGDRKLELDSTFLLPYNINSSHENYYGNLGQDVIGSFDQMTLNFKDMFIIFTDNAKMIIGE